VTALTTWDIELRVPEDADLDAAGESRTIEVREDQAILTAARAADIWLSADCQQGWCITCGAKLLSGEVDHSQAKRYYPEDEAAGFVPPPASRAPARIASLKSNATASCSDTAPITTDRRAGRSSGKGARVSAGTRAVAADRTVCETGAGNCPPNVFRSAAVGTPMTEPTTPQFTGIALRW